MRLITLTSTRDGSKVYVNPANIMTVSECFGGEATIIEFIDGDSYVKVLESAESIAKMVEGEEDG